jgi:drug/metabolite transporter (DMT)-like permease
MTARTWALFALVSTLWGIPYLFIKVAVDDGVPPVFLAWARVALGAVVLLALAWRAGTLASLRGRWRWIAVYAVIEIAIPFPLIAAGEIRISSSLAAILVATVPMLIALFALRFDHTERVTGSRLVGLFVGFAGVVALMGIDVAGRTSELIGAALVLLACVGYAAGPMIFNRKFTDLDPRASMGATLLVVTVVLAPFAALYPPETTPSGDALLSIAVLGFLCTAAAFVTFGMLVRDIGPSRTAVLTYIAPIVAVALGVTVLGERPGAGAVAGLLLILAGSWLSTDGRVPPGLMAVIAKATRRTPSSPPLVRSTA